MIKHEWYTKPENNDLNLYQSGFEECTPGHSYGPALRNHYLIHYITSGKGYYQLGDKKYTISKKQGFLICPETISYYEADQNDPWTYYWIGFNGSKADEILNNCNLSSENPIFFYSNSEKIKNLIDKMPGFNKISPGHKLHLTSLLYEFMALLSESNIKNIAELEEENVQVYYIKKVIEYIQQNYSHTITINGIAEYIGFNRSYLGSIFKKHAGMPPQEFLQKYRISKACELLQDKTLCIGDISRSVGYNNPLYFSKAFKKIKNKSPSEYREKARGWKHNERKAAYMAK